MPIQQIAIPSYLEPPSQAEQEQLKLQRQRMQYEMSKEFADRIQKRIAMEKMLGDVKQAQAAGIDPQEAQQQAIANNAESLFSDDPQKALAFKDKALQAISRRRAIQNYKTELSANVASGMDYSEAAAAAWSKHGMDITPSGFGASISRDYATDQLAATRAEQARIARERIQSNLEMAAERNARIVSEKEKERVFKADELNLTLGSQESRAAQAEAGKNQRAQNRNVLHTRALDIAETKANRPTTAETKAIKEKQDDLKDVNRRLAEHLASEPKYFGRAKWEAIKKNLEQEKDDTIKELNDLQKQLEKPRSRQEQDTGDAPTDDPLGMFTTPTEAQ